MPNHTPRPSTTPRRLTLKRPQQGALGSNRGLPQSILQVQREPTP